MILLTLDPSSTAIGFCVSTGHGKLVDAGKITDRGKTAYLRLAKMLPELDAIIEQHKPDKVLIETPAPQASCGRNNRGQATYGMAVGRVFERIEAKHNITPEWTAADKWTGRVSKRKRQIFVEQKYRHVGYDAAKDKGGDIADAIGLADWWWTRRMVG